MADHLFWLSLACLKGIGSKSFLKLYEQDPHLNGDKLLDQAESIKDWRIKRALTEENISQAQELARRLLQVQEEVGIQVISLADSRYPLYLRLIPDPPPIIYAKGNIDLLQAEETLAIVGTRQPTLQGYRAGERIAEDFARRGYVIVSGLARGIDRAAHEASLKVDGRTIAVLAGDLRELYPVENRPLAERILAQDGLLLSETPLGQRPVRGHFVRRNRIQSGLSLAVCPVQTALRGGTQRTLQFAREQGRFIFTPLPAAEDLGKELVQGNLQLIEEGWGLLENTSSYEGLIRRLEDDRKRLKAEHGRRFGGRGLGARAGEQGSFFD